MHLLERILRLNKTRYKYIQHYANATSRICLNIDILANSSDDFSFSNPPTPDLHYIVHESTSAAMRLKQIALRFDNGNRRLAPKAPLSRQQRQAITGCTHLKWDLSFL